MPYYAAPYCPEHLFFNNSRNEKQARLKVAQELSDLVNSGALKVNIPNGFSIRRFVKITTEDLMSKEEEKISNAVKILSKLSYSKNKTQGHLD
ncbi:hypothetical protein QGP82_20155 [Leptothoe sp. LEGE 181152]|nr:hypothetical protein [Leptothoe sp. LEGE 181152]